MPFATLLSLLDDIAVVMDDVAILTKIAAKKTTGVIGDDLALNAEQVTGVRAERELPVVWAVAKGSALNKAILIPAALAASALLPWIVQPLLMIGGGYLSFEGFEKIAHKYLHSKEEDVESRAELARALLDPEADFKQVEADKIKGAIRTDFVLSAEIIIITLGVVAETAFVPRVLVLLAVAVLMTVGVYGFVAAIVKLDDGALLLTRKEGDGAWSRVSRRMGSLILRGAPYLMRGLSIAGTVAMFLVGGGIIIHGIAPLHHLVQSIEARVHPMTGEAFAWLVPSAMEGIVGIVVGALLVAVWTIIKRMFFKDGARKTRHE